MKLVNELCMPFRRRKKQKVKAKEKSNKIYYAWHLWQFAICTGIRDQTNRENELIFRGFFVKHANRLNSICLFSFPWGFTITERHSVFTLCYAIVHSAQCLVTMAWGVDCFLFINSIQIPNDPQLPMSLHLIKGFFLFSLDIVFARCQHQCEQPFYPFCLHDVYIYVVFDCKNEKWTCP